MTQKQLFWLHVKKSAGKTTRSLLQPHYVTVDHTKKPKTFIQSAPEEYNDILNNHRVVLGEYQFKRCLFAKKYLYPGKWDDIFSFAISRNPVDRCVSMFYFLFWDDTRQRKNFTLSLRMFVSGKKLILNTSNAFDLFLDYVLRARNGKNNYHPLGIHFKTHTASMWDDITDFDGKVLLKAVYRLENLMEGLNLAFEECGIDKRLDDNDKISYKIRSKNYRPNKSQIRKIEELFCNDFEVYENARLLK